MRERTYLFAMNGGEVSPLALGRVDLSRMRISAETMKNCFPRVIGPMTARPGLGHVGNTSDHDTGRLIPFIFSAEDTALVELTDGNMRLWIDDTVLTRPSVSTTIGEGVLDSSTGWTLTATGNGVVDINSTNASELTMQTPSLGDTVVAKRSDSVSGPDQGVEHSVHIEVVRGPVEFRLGTSDGDDDLITKTDLDTGHHHLSFTPNVGTIYTYLTVESLSERRVATLEIESSGNVDIATPWAEADLFKLRYAQSGDVIYVVSSDRAYQPMIVERRGTRSWSLVEYEFFDGPFLGKTGNVTMGIAALKGDGSLTASDDFWKSGHVGSVFRVYNPGTALVENLTGGDRWTDTIRVSGNTRYDIDGDGSNENTEERDVTLTTVGAWSGTLSAQIADDPDGPWRPFDNWTSNQSAITLTPGPDNSIVYLRFGFDFAGYTSGFVQVTASYLGGGGSGMARIREITSDTVAQKETTKRFHSGVSGVEWDEGLFSGYRGWPSAVGLFDGRLWFGGLDKICGSVSDGYKSFDPDVEGDSGPIVRSIATGPVNSIQWILGLSRLCMGTSGAEPVARSSSFDEPMTPTNFSIKDASTQGSADVQAVKIDRSAIFVQRSGKRAYDMSYSINAQDYTSTEITRFHPTVLDAGVKLIAVQRQPDTRIWFVLNDGTCAILTYERSEDVLSWYTFETDGSIEDVAVLPNTSDDDVYLVVNRTIDGATRRYIEKLAYDTQAQGGDTNYMADSYVTTVLAASATVTGLSHLEGETVVVWANGEAIMDGDVPDTFTVSSGQITLPSVVTGTVIVGLSYDWQWQSAKLAYGVSDGAPLSRRKTVRDLAPILYKTHMRGIRAGQTFDAMDYLPLSYKGQTMDANMVLEAYDAQSYCIPGTWDTDARLCLAGQAPLPCTVLSLSLTMETN